jgi:hemoglobin
VGSSLVDELGGTDAVAAAVDDLYRRLLADPSTAHYFWGIDLRRVRAHMADFLIAALDGPDRYTGRNLDIAHADLGITHDAFDSTTSHLLGVLEDRQVRPELLDAVLERIAAFRSLVVGG